MRERENDAQSRKADLDELDKQLEKLKREENGGRIQESVDDMDEGPAKHKSRASLEKKPKGKGRKDRSSTYEENEGSEYIPSDDDL